MNTQKQRDEIVSMARICYEDRLFAGTSGNLSVYNAEEEVMTITPTSVSYSTMKAEDAVCMKLDGTIISGHFPPSSEWRMHAGIYLKRPDVGAVVHTHSPYATSFAVTHQLVPVILIEMIPFLGGDIPLAGFALPGTSEMADEALNVLDERGACLLANHGVLSIGDTLQKAYIRAIYAEDAAKIYGLALSHGNAVVISEKNILKMREKMLIKKGAPENEKS
jgi:L-ribulose-5-phosphate 4-epimerase